MHNCACRALQKEYSTEEGTTHTTFAVAIFGQLKVVCLTGDLFLKHSEELCGGSALPTCPCVYHLFLHPEERSETPGHSANPCAVVAQDSLPFSAPSLPSQKSSVLVLLFPLRDIWLKIQVLAGLLTVDDVGREGRRDEEEPSKTVTNPNKQKNPPKTEASGCSGTGL
jgi:hypothetical protein